MGIPSYFSHIIKNHRNIIQNVNSVSSIQNLYLDSNSIIYDCAYKLMNTYQNDSQFEELLLKEVQNTLLNHIDKLKPKRVFIAFDGVAPIAKLQQQRERRFKSQFFNELYESVNIKNNNKWNTVAITPGTPFMNKLHTFFNNFESKIKQKFSFVKEAIFSSWAIAGEGEHKIFEFIRNSNHMNEVTLIYGLDADLIMLCICHLQYCNKLYLYRETPEFIKSIDSSLKPNESYILHIDYLGDQIHYLLNSQKNKQNTNKYDILQDYIFLCFLLGNDFMPHFPALNIRTNGIYNLMECYNQNMTNTIIQNGKIKWKEFRDFVNILTKYEELWIIEEYDSLVKKESRFIKASNDEELKNKIMNIPCSNRSIEHFINPHEQDWQNRYYDKCFHIEYEEKRVKQICHNFLEALEWTYTYYTNGCKCWEWKYNHNYAPLLSDIYKYIPYFDTEFITSGCDTPLSPHIQLAYVLPYDSLNFIQHNNIDKLKSYLESIHSSYSIEWTFCKYLWEAHVHMPDIKIKTLQSIMVS